MKCRSRLSVSSSAAFLIFSRLLHSNRALNTIPPLLLSIEGNIGAGKSTLIGELRRRHPTWNFVDEPVGIWSQLKNDEGESLLEVFYKDRKRWSYTFQSCALLSRFQNIENSIKQRSSSALETTKNTAMKIIEREVFITERCLDTDFHVFTKMLREERSINKLEFEIYDRLYQHLKSASTPLSAIIHVSTDPGECLKRIAIRNRTGENEITKEYLTNLEKCQTDWITSCEVPVLRSDQTSVILSEVESFVQRILDEKRL